MDRLKRYVRPQITKEEGCVLYEDMYLGRAFEDMCAQAGSGPKRCTLTRTLSLLLHRSCLSAPGLATEHIPVADVLPWQDVRVRAPL